MTKQEAAEVLRDYFEQRNSGYTSKVKGVKTFNSKVAAYLWIQQEAAKYGKDWNESV